MYSQTRSASPTHAARLAVAATTVLFLAACGTAPKDRALSGAGIGAATGAAATVITGGSTAAGAIVGGAVGAAVGALTEEDDIDLGKPAWK